MDRHLIDYLPLYEREYREIQEIMQADEKELSEIWKLLEDLLNDQFVQTATDKGISRWESILGIEPRNIDTLDERRFKILVKLNEQLPYTLSTVKEQLNMLCGADGYQFILDSNNYTVTVNLELRNKNNYHTVYDYLRKAVPANMEIVMSLLYNTYSMLAQFTHHQLSKYTYAQLREDVL